MKIVIPLTLLLLSGCMSVEKLGPYELAPARNPPSMTVRPTTLQTVYRTSDCIDSEVNGVCRASISPEG
jgi:PBP1b-binding outer membrane lipoprotein LpoB